MTNEFKALMQLVGAAAQGKAISDLPDDLDWPKLERLANEQAVQTLLGYALKLSPGLLMLHLIKHFIMTGMSLRMMLDVALFFSHHAGRIDSARFWKTMESLKYGTIAQSILWAMVRYCGIEAASIPGLCEACPKQVGIILDDLENGGWLGKIDEKAREEGWYEYNRQLLMKNRSKAQYLLFMLRWKIGAYLKALFPSRKTLAIRYPCVQKSVIVIPFAWVHSSRGS